MKLVPAQIMFISLILIGLMLTGGWGYIEFSVYGTEEIILEDDLNKIKDKFLEINAVNVNFDEVKQKYEEELVNFDSLKYVVATRDNFVEILQLIKVLAEKNEVEIMGIAPEMEDSFPAIKSILETTGKHIERYPIHCRIKGDFLKIGAFLESLETIASALNIGKIKMNTMLEKDGRISSDLVLFSYIYLEEIKGK